MVERAVDVLMMSYMFVAEVCVFSDFDAVVSRSCGFA